MVKYADEAPNTTIPEKFFLILDFINCVYFRTKLILF